jgi:hypothetical protein
MTNFDKIDDYLGNRLSPDERASFENALTGDPALRKELAHQTIIVKAVRHARAAELKNMLQQVPVPSSGWSAGQVAASVITVAVVATGLYFYFQPDQLETTVPTTPELTVQPDSTPEPSQPETTPETTATPATEDKKTAASAKEEKKVSPVQKPDIQVVDPSAEFAETKEPESPQATPATHQELTVSKLDVVTQAADKKYSFHYQFSQGKLHLFGPFDRNLYEILEINGDSHAVFLFYKENYYLLDESQTDIMPLSPIRDGKLLKMLREYRSR